MRAARTVPRGRQVDPQARASVAALLGDRPRRRDLLIEHLHLIQDAHGQIPAALLAALAEEMRLPFAEVFEVASFYAHFDIVREDAAPLPPLIVRVCDGLPCAMAGAGTLADNLAARVGSDVRVLRAPCVGRCDTAPSVEVGHHFIDHAATETVLDAVARRAVAPHIPNYIDHASYVAWGGYELLARLRRGEITHEAILDILDRGNLRGFGGAGFPIGRKWKAVRAQPGPRVMAVNADEGEPGTFKDRFYLERDPHRFIEGMLIGAESIEAADIYVYLRDEYPAARHILQTEFPKLPPGGPRIHLRRGAGAYICGEESAMLESIEGKRGLPRHKPPFIFEQGLFGRPTLANNVETLWWIRDLVNLGPDWWLAHGRHGRRGLRSYSVSGRVRQPGVKLAHAGVTIRELIEEYCGGMQPGHRFRAYLPGGASGGILPASMDAIPLDFGTLEEYGCFIGSAAVIVLSDQDDIRQAALNLMRFFEDESCGQCTPCRIGTQKAAALMERETWDAALLKELSQAMRDASICGLGQAAPNPLLTTLAYFPEVFAP